MKDKEEKIALFRYGIIAPVIHGNNQSEYFREMEQKKFEVPFNGPKKYSLSTFKKWLFAYRKYGIDGLKPKQRFDKNSFKLINEELENIIKGAISDYQPVSSAHLYRLLLSDNKISESEFSYNTLRRFVSRNKLLEKIDKTPRKKFEKEHVNELWVSDFMHGPLIDKKRTYLCCIIDDHSRVLVGYGWYFSESSLSLEQTLKKAMGRYGLPKVFYCDNGSAFISDNLQMSCARVGIALVHTKPYDPAAKGKIERFNRTVRQVFMPDADFSDIISLNQSFADWVEKEYNKKIHSSTKEAPMNRFLSDMEKTKPKRIPEVELNQAFYHRLTRKVKKDSTVSVNSCTYEIPSKYSGENIEIRFASEKPDELFLYENGKSVLKLKEINLSENANFRQIPIFTVIKETKNV